MHTEHSTRDAALERFVRAHQADVWRYLRVLGCDAATADDLTQDVLVRTMRGSAIALPAPAQRNYLRRAAKNAVIQAARDARLVACVDDLEQVAPFETASDCGSDDWVDALRTCLEQVDSHTRTILDRRYRDGHRAAEIGAEFGIREAHVNTVIHRTKTALRRCIEGRLR